jgi:hypothetical protein
MTKKALATKPIDMNVIEYNITDAAIAKMRKTYQGLVIKDSASYETVRKGIAEIRTKRVEVENRRKELKAEALEYGRKADAEAKRITAALTGIEDPLKEEKEKDDAHAEAIKMEKERVERERVNEIRVRIDGIKGYPMACSGKSSSDILAEINALSAIYFTEPEFQEFLPDANRAKEEALEALDKLYSERVAWENAEAERKAEIEKLEKLRKEQEAEAERQAEERSKIDEEKAEIEAAKEADRKKKEREEFERQAKEKAEKEAREKLEREKREEAERKANEEAERKRQGALRPDKEKLITWADSFITLAGGGVIVSDKKAAAIVQSYTERFCSVAYELKLEADEL